MNPTPTIPRTDLRVADARAGNFDGSAIPPDLSRQWIQGTGPATKPRSTVESGLRNVAYALLSGADGWMFDGEDALGQVDTMSLDSQRNLKLAIDRDRLFLQTAERVAGEMNRWAESFLGRRIVENWRAQLDFTTKIFRVRGLHLDDRHLREADGVGFSATLADLVPYVVNNYRRFLSEGSSIVLYLPKIETAEEAALLNDMISALELHLGLEIGTVKTYVLVERIEACFQLMEIRAALAPHFVGFNTGRWDYINSVADAMAWAPDFVDPNIDEIVMTYGYMRAYEDRVRRAVNTPDRNGHCALWQGGMEPNIPVGSADGVAAGMKRAVAGAEREQREGASGKWVAHWKMVHIVRPVWERVGRDNQLGREFPPLTYSPDDAKGLVHLKPAPRTVRGCARRRLQADYAAHRAGDRRDVRPGSGQASLVHRSAEPQPEQSRSGNRPPAHPEVHGRLPDRRHAVDREPGPWRARMNTMTRDARRTPTTFEEAARRSYVTDEERSSTPVIDYRPFIIADADTGHGGDPRVRNLVRRFVEVGVPGYHIEDQRPGTKKCGHQGGKVLVAQDEQIKRLNAARFQLDVMGVPGIIVARTDAEAATLLDRRSDERDQPFLLGATNVGLPSYKICTLALMKRLDEAVSEPVNGHIPDKMLAYNLSLSFNWDTTGMTDDEMGRFPEELGKMGFVFNFMTYVTRDTDRLANVVFATVVDRKGWRILSVRDQNTFDESLRQKRLMTLVHVWLIHRYRAQSVHYVSPTDDNRYTWSFKWGITELSDSQMHGMSDDIWIGGFIFNFIKRVRHHGGEK